MSCSKYIHTVVEEIKELAKKVSIGQGTLNVKSFLMFCDNSQISSEIMHFILVYDF